MNIRFLVFPAVLMSFFVLCGTTQQPQSDVPVRPRLKLPELQFWQSSYSEDQILDAALNYFHNNRLTLTEHDIEDVIAEINYYGYILRIDTKKMLRSLREIIETKLLCCKERVEKRNYYKNLIFDYAQCIGLAALSAAFMGATYAIYKKWDQGSDSTIDTTKQELKRMDIEVITDYDYDFRRRFVKLIPPMELSDQQRSVAKDYQKQLIHAFRVQDWARSMEVLSAFASFGFGVLAFKNTFDCLVPKHQEYYEELLLIRWKITAHLNA